MFDELIEELKSLPEVRAIALGGSRASRIYDAASDYDVYIYTSQPIAEEKRLEILGKYCSKAEIGNTFWETEDNVIMKDGIPADLIYRSLPDFQLTLINTLEHYKASNGYTTCMWYNLLNSKVLYDPQGEYAALQKKYNIAYPPILRQNILRRNTALLYGKLPNYRDQIAKAIRRQDLLSVNHRTSAFMESYFDVLFALNSQPHPGEKRLITQALRYCSILPVSFERLLYDYFNSLYADPIRAVEYLDAIIENLKGILPPEYRQA